jgi:hypothetical protein
VPSSSWDQKVDANPYPLVSVGGRYDDHRR